jgi:hypothetical protein
MASAPTVIDRALPGKLRIPDSRDIHVFLGIEHTAISIHIGYTIESFLIHIATVPSGRDNKCIPIRISGSSSIHAFLVQNR